MGFIIIMPILMLLFVLLSILGRVIIAIWIYHDAENRGMNPLLWTLLIVFTSVIIVFIVYVLIRKPSFDPKKGLGLLITGCVLTLLSFIMGLLLLASVAMGFASEIENYNYEGHDIYENDRDVDRDNDDL